MIYTPYRIYAQDRLMTGRLIGVIWTISAVRREAGP